MFDIEHRLKPEFKSELMLANVPLMSKGRLGGLRFNRLEIRKGRKDS